MIETIHSPVTVYGRKESKLCVNEFCGEYTEVEKEDLFFFPLKNLELATGPCISGLQHKPFSCWQERLEKVLSYFGSNLSVCISFFLCPLRGAWLSSMNSSYKYTFCVCLEQILSLLLKSGKFLSVLWKLMGGRSGWSEWVPSLGQYLLVCPAPAYAPAVRQCTCIFEHVAAWPVGTYDSWEELRIMQGTAGNVEGAGVIAVGQCRVDTTKSSLH